MSISFLPSADSIWIAVAYSVAYYIAITNEWEGIQFNFVN